MVLYAGIGAGVLVILAIVGFFWNRSRNSQHAPDLQQQPFLVQPNAPAAPPPKAVSAPPPRQANYTVHHNEKGEEFYQLPDGSVTWDKPQ
jgi:hypothetical protein